MKTKQITISVPSRFKYKVTQPWGIVELHEKKPKIHDEGEGDQYWSGQGEYFEFCFEKTQACPNWKQTLEKI